MDARTRDRIDEAHSMASVHHRSTRPYIAGAIGGVVASVLITLSLHFLRL